MMSDLVATQDQTGPFLGGTFAAEDFQYVHFLSRLWTFPSSCLIDLRAEAIKSQPYIEQSLIISREGLILTLSILPCPQGRIF